VLDGALQACVAAMGGGLPNEALLPLAVESFRVLGPVPPRVCAELSVERASGASGSLLARIELRDLAPREVYDEKTANEESDRLMLEAQRLNETARIYVNLLAANVRRRLQMLAGDAGSYRPNGGVAAYA